LRGDLDLYDADPMEHLKPSPTRSREAMNRLQAGEFDVKPHANGDFEVTTSPFPPAMRRRQEAYEAKLREPDKVTASFDAARADGTQLTAGTNLDNPKDKFGAAKPCLTFIPPAALAHEAVVMALGAAKYSPFNWRSKPVKAKTYVDAAIRHLLQWADGEELDEQSRASHLAHARACCGIILDAQTQGNLIDDRHKTGGFTAILEGLTRKV